MQILPAISIDLLGDGAGRQLGVADQRRRGREREGPAGSDRGNSFVGLDHIAVAADDEDVLDVGDQQRASRCRSTLSVRQSLASSTTERERLPLNCSSFDSKRANNEKASAVDPAKPARILSLYKRLSFFAELFRTSWPKVTCPSAAITTFPSRRTQITVVERMRLFHLVETSV